MSWGQSWGTAWGAAWGDSQSPTPSPGINAWGTSWGGSWGDAWGGSSPSFTVASVTVRAFRPMFFNGVLRAVGSQFYITSPYQFTPYGMVLVGTPPADWSQFIEAYSENADNDRIRMPGRDETRIPSRNNSVPQEPGNPYD